MRGMMGMSKVPFGDLSGSVEVNEDSVAAFLLSNSMVMVVAVKTHQKPLELEWIGKKKKWGQFRKVTIF